MKLVHDETCRLGHGFACAHCQLMAMEWEWIKGNRHVGDESDIERLCHATGEDYDKVMADLREITVKREGTASIRERWEEGISSMTTAEKAKAKKAVTEIIDSIGR